MVNGWRANNHKAHSKWVQTIVQRSRRFWYYVFFFVLRAWILFAFDHFEQQYRHNAELLWNILIRLCILLLLLIRLYVCMSGGMVSVLYCAMCVLYCPRGFPSTMSDSTSCSLTFAALHWSILRQLTITNEKQMICFFVFICVSSHSVHSTHIPCSTQCSSLFSWIDKNEWDQVNSHIGDGPQQNHIRSCI